MTIFCDLDGVGADFDRGYYETFGVRPDKSTNDPGGIDWKLVAECPGFFASLPMMPDFPKLWDHIRKFDPIILTGVPDDVPGAARDKLSWVTKHLGPLAEIVCCKSKDKCQYSGPNHVLIDDWEKYRHLWVEKGGIWITHVNANQTIAALRALGYN